jgi:hypothetical protein
VKKVIPDKYVIINCIFAGILAAVFIYSFIYGFKGLTHPIPSGSQFFGEQPVISSGMSRSFSAMTHLNFEAAKNLNVYGPQIFLFFVIQLFMRIAGIALFSFSNRFQKKIIVIADGVVSSVLFVVFFMPFIREAAGLFFC